VSRWRRSAADDAPAAAPGDESRPAGRPSERPQPARVPRPGRRIVGQLLAAGAILVVAAGTTAASVLWFEADSIGDAFSHGPIASVGDTVKPAKHGEPQTILLVGDDHRFQTEDGAPTPKGEPTRADTMILVRLDPEANATTMLSLPRDLLVNPNGAGGQKLNAAFTNGPAALIRTLKQLLGTPGERFEINRYVSIRFTAFSQAVNTFGCFYTDVDRRYFNDNNPPVGGGGRYGEIDVEAGYQRLCGEDSLAFVRFRHLDNTIVREARQTNYLADARSQIAGSRLFGERRRLVREVRPHIETNKVSTRELLRLISLVADVADQPTKRVQLEVGFTPGGDATATPEALRAATKAFLHPDQVPGEGTRAAKSAPSAAARTRPARKRAARRKKAATPSSLGSDPAAAQGVVTRDISGDLDALPVLYPKLVHRNATYPEGHSRAYDIRSPGGMTFPWQAYRIVVRLGPAAGGQYYGVQGTDWKDPPVLALADDEERLGGRTFLVQYDGKRIRRMMLRTRTGTYWVSNSMNGALTNPEMRAIAKSLVTFRR